MARLAVNGIEHALDPAYATNHVVYTYLIEASTLRLRVDRFTLGSTGSATLASRHLVWTSPGKIVDSANPYHVGGSLNFGPDGDLYLTVGENTNGPNSQDLTNVFGKVLRFRPDGTVPTDNPYHDGTGPHVDEIWATGIRNGFRGSFDTNGDFWLGDVGGNNATTAYEEVDLITKGANYGWPSCEGPLGQPKNGASCPAGVTGPLYSYTHDGSAGTAVSVTRRVVRSSRRTPSACSSLSMRRLKAGCEMCTASAALRPLRIMPLSDTSSQ